MHNEEEEEGEEEELSLACMLPPGVKLFQLENRDTLQNDEFLNTLETEKFSLKDEMLRFTQSENNIQV